MEDLDFKYLRYAIEVARYGSMTRAAQKLYLAQPNLSRAIGNLDMLESMDNLVMLSCHVHSKIIARNELAAVPLHPDVMAYEYGYVTRADRPVSQDAERLLERIGEAVREEFAYIDNHQNKK